LLINKHPDGEHIVIETEIEGNVVGHGIFDAVEIENIIRALSRLRSELSTPVPTSLEPHPRIETVTEPGYDIRSVPGQMVLALRHPGYGWVGYSFGEDRGHRLGSQIQLAAGAL
jgi:hypothetical protein